MQFREFFHLKENPFGETPDPQFYFSSLPHEAALRKISWAIEENKSLVLVEGEVGNGKTMLSRIFHDSLCGEANTAVIVHPYSDPAELLAHICRDFGFRTSPDLNSLNAALLTAAEVGKRNILIVDEAQSLSASCLEFLRQLTNLETDKRKLLQIVFFAQPEFSRRLASPGLRQLQQRLQLKISLAPLNAEDTAAYIRHRVEKAGGGSFLRFEAEALEWIHRQSGGAPRVINKICELSLRFAAKNQMRHINAKWIRTLPFEQVGIKRKSFA
ncbi:MAG: ExeA family protein, partial [Bdellovibrionota bacterium]